MLRAVDAERFADERVGQPVRRRAAAGPDRARADQPPAAAAAGRAAGQPGHPQRAGDHRACWPGSPRSSSVAVLLSAHEMNPLLPVMDRVVYLAGGRAASGTTDEVVRSEVLSELYGHHVDVIRVHGRVLVVAGPATGWTATRGPARRPGRSRPRRRADAGPVHPALHRARLRARASSPARRSSCAARPIGGVRRLVSAVVGVFTVMRGQSFAGHALGDVCVDRRLGRAAARAQPAARASSGLGVAGGRRDGHDRDPPPARPGPGHRHRARRRPRPGGPVPLPGTPPHSATTGATLSDPVRLHLHHSARGHPARRDPRRGRARPSSPCCTGRCC